MSTSTALQARSGQLRTYLDKPAIKQQLAAALPKHMNPDRMIRVALTAAVRTPKLLECTPESIYESLLNASQLGLEPNGRDAHLIPFRDNKAGVTKCQLMPDYKGLIQLAYRSGQIDSFTAKAVFQKDHFVFRYGLHEDLEHVPCTEDDPGELVYAWAMCRFKNGGYKFVVLNRRDINRRMASSKTAGRSDSPWKTHTEAMWAKSAAKELAKWIPQTPEMHNFVEAVEHDNHIEYGNNETIDVESQPALSKSDELADQLGSSTEATDEEPEPTPTPNNEAVEKYLAHIAKQDAIGECDRLANEVREHDGLTDAEKTLLVDACEQWKTAIRGKRGERSN